MRLAAGSVGGTTTSTPSPRSSCTQACRSTPAPSKAFQHLVQRLVQVEQDIIVVLRPAEAGDVDGEQPAYLEPPPLWGSKTRSAVAVALR